MYNVLGNFLTLSSFGESHGEAYGGIITNFPAGLEIDLEKVQLELDRRKPGQSAIVTQRKEGDKGSMTVDQFIEMTAPARSIIR